MHTCSGHRHVTTHDDSDDFPSFHRDSTWTAADDFLLLEWWGRLAAGSSFRGVRCMQSNYLLQIFGFDVDVDVDIVASRPRRRARR